MLLNRAFSAEYIDTAGTTGGDPFGDTSVVWEDAGEEGLVPRKIASRGAGTNSSSPTRPIVGSPQQVSVEGERNDVLCVGVF